MEREKIQGLMDFLSGPIKAARDYRENIVEYLANPNHVYWKNVRAGLSFAEGSQRCRTRREQLQSELGRLNGRIPEMEGWQKMLSDELRMMETVRETVEEFEREGVLPMAVNPFTYNGPDFDDVDNRENIDRSDSDDNARIDFIEQWKSSDGDDVPF